MGPHSLIPVSWPALTTVGRRKKKKRKGKKEKGKKEKKKQVQKKHVREAGLRAHAAPALEVHHAGTCCRL